MAMSFGGFGTFTGASPHSYSISGGTGGVTYAAVSVSRFASGVISSVTAFGDTLSFSHSVSVLTPALIFIDWFEGPVTPSTSVFTTTFTGGVLGSIGHTFRGGGIQVDTDTFADASHGPGTFSIALANGDADAIASSSMFISLAHATSFLVGAGHTLAGGIFFAGTGVHQSSFRLGVDFDPGPGSTDMTWGTTGGPGAAELIGSMIVDVAEGIIPITGEPLEPGPEGGGQDSPFQMGGWPGYSPRDLSYFSYNFLKTGKQVQKIIKRIRLV